MLEVAIAVGKSLVGLWICREASETAEAFGLVLGLERTEGRGVLEGDEALPEGGC